MKAESIIAFGLAVFVIAFLIGEYAGRREERERRYQRRRNQQLIDRIDRYGAR